MTLQSKCEVCASSMREVIDRELAGGQHPGTVADMFGLSTHAVRKHGKVCRTQSAPAPTASVPASTVEQDVPRLWTKAEVQVVIREMLVDLVAIGKETPIDGE